MALFLPLRIFGQFRGLVSKQHVFVGECFAMAVTVEDGY